jgi:hypothetical protein
MHSHKMKILMSFISLVLLIGLIAGCSAKAAATTGGLKITVLDNKALPLSGAKVESTSQPDGQSPVSQMSTADGIPVDFEGLLPGQYSWKVSKSGYVETVININIVVGQSFGLSVNLNPMPTVTTQ